jgi:hypothetical protein
MKGVEYYLEIQRESYKTMLLFIQTGDSVESLAAIPALPPDYMNAQATVPVRMRFYLSGSHISTEFNPWTPSLLHEHGMKSCLVFYMDSET